MSFVLFVFAFVAFVVHRRGLTSCGRGATLAAMAENRSLEATCRDCGQPLSFHAGETKPARCVECFDGFIR